MRRRLYAGRFSPNAIFLSTDFPVIEQSRARCAKSFRRHTDLSEPLSLDEAYLDVFGEPNGLANCYASCAHDPRRDWLRTGLDRVGGHSAKPLESLAGCGATNPSACFANKIVPAAKQFIDAIGIMREHALFPHCPSATRWFPSCTELCLLKRPSTS